MPWLLVHTNFGDGLRLKRQYLRNHTSDHHDKHIDTKLYPLRVQSWKARWKSSSNVWDTWQNAKEGKLSALQHKTRPFSVCGTATKLVLSRVDRHLFPRNFVHWVQGDPGSHNNRKWLLFARRRAAAADRPLKRALFLELVNVERTPQLEFTVDSHKWSTSVWVRKRPFHWYLSFENPC